MAVLVARLSLVQSVIGTRGPLSCCGGGDVRGWWIHSVGGGLVTERGAERMVVLVMMAREASDGKCAERECVRESFE